MMTKINVSKFNRVDGTEVPFRVSGTRVGIAQCSAPAVLMSVNGGGFFTMPRGGHVKLVESAAVVRIKSIDGEPIRGELWHGDAEVDFSGVEKMSRPEEGAFLGGVTASTTLVNEVDNVYGGALHSIYMAGTTDQSSLYLFKGGSFLRLLNSVNGVVQLQNPLEMLPGYGLRVVKGDVTPVTIGVGLEWF